eukprot:8680998-Pyramimonas_sp.AAC.1
MSPLVPGHVGIRGQLNLVSSVREKLGMVLFNVCPDCARTVSDEVGDPNGKVRAAQMTLLM